MHDDITIDEFADLVAERLQERSKVAFIKGAYKGARTLGKGLMKTHKMGTKSLRQQRKALGKLDKAIRKARKSGDKTLVTQLKARRKGLRKSVKGTRNTVYGMRGLAAAGVGGGAAVGAGAGAGGMYLGTRRR